ncbi:hypothetical protein HK097_006513, partial [Rhizophlyctis rosea]
VGVNGKGGVLKTESPGPGASGPSTPVGTDGDDKRVRNDAFVFGHPSGSKYRSTNEFILHLLWMISDDTHDYRLCTCKLCPSYLKFGLRQQQTPSAKPQTTTSKFASPLPRPQPPTVPTTSYTTSSTPRPPAHSDSEDLPPDLDVPPRSSMKHKHKHREEGGGGGTGSRDKEGKYKKKYRDLKRKIGELEQENQNLMATWGESKRKIARLKFERSIILERMEKIPDLTGGKAEIDEETMSTSTTSRTPSPTPHSHHTNHHRTSHHPTAYAPTQQPPQHIPVIVMPSKTADKKKKVKGP